MNWDVLEGKDAELAAYQEKWVLTLLIGPGSIRTIKEAAEKAPDGSG